MRLANLFLLLIALSPPANGQPGKLYFDQLTTVDGLPENSVQAMLQDHLGFMWLGTRNGLVRYDGVDMTVFHDKPDNPYSLKGRSVKYLYEDRQGDIWVGCVGGLYRFERSTERFYAYSPKGKAAFSATDEVTFIHQDKTGSFWIVTFRTDGRLHRELSRYDPVTDTWKQYLHDPQNARSLVYNEVNDMSATGPERTCLIEDKQGGIWVVTREGHTSYSESILHRYDRTHDNFVPYRPKGRSGEGPIMRNVRLPFVDRKSRLWLPTIGNGLFCVNPVTNQIIAHFRHNRQNQYSLTNDSVRTVYEDRSGFLWVSTIQGLDRLDPKTSLFTHFPYDPANSHAPHDKILDAFGETPDGHIWFLTTLGGLDEYDPRTGHFLGYNDREAYPGAIVSSRKFPSFLIDNTGLIWLGTGVAYTGYGLVAGSGLNKQSRVTRFSSFTYSSAKTTTKAAATVMYELPSEPGTLWIGTKQGLDRYEPTTNQVTHYPLDLKNYIAFNQDRVTSLTEDARGRFWVGTTFGLYRMDRRRGTFTPFRQDPTTSQSLNTNLVTALLADRDGTLWVGTNAGLNRYNPDTGQFTHYYMADTTYHPALFRFLRTIAAPSRRLAAVWRSAILQHNTASFSIHEPTKLVVSAMGAIKSATRDEYGWIEDAKGHTVWEMTYVRTRFAGVYSYRIQLDTIQLPAGTYRLHYKSEAPERIVFQARGSISPTPYYPELWGIQVLNVSPAEATELNRLKKKWDCNGLSNLDIRTLYQDRKGFVWIGTGFGGLNRFDPRTGRFTHINPSGKSLTSITAIHEDATGNLWLGDYANGLFCYNPKKGVIKQYTAAVGLSHNSVTSIQADNWGQLWLSTYNGICRFDPKTQRFRTYTTANGLSGMIFPYPSFKSAAGTLFFLGEHGINTLAPGQRYDDPHPPRVLFTDVNIFNRKASIGPGEPLQKHISVAEKLTLAHDQNDVTFHFAALHYIRSAECRYAVRLEPYDKDWVALGMSRQVRYMALAPGTYTFRVKAANADGVWNEKGVSVQVVVLPPWWRTWWAYALYALGACGFVLGFVRYRIEQGRQQQEMAFRHREAEHLRAMDELKTRFFSNITHEFRTPLSLIMAPAETLLEEETRPVKRGLLTTIQRNASQLLNLINQLLDLSKLEAGKMAVSEVRGNLSEFVGQLIDTFKPMAWQRQLTITFDTDELPGESIFDAGKWERIISNLLANALKFTPEQGTVTISLRAEADANVRLTISDTGIGIAPEQLPHIFDRFYQRSDDSADDSRTRTYEGTGIGLALVKELTDLLGGVITVRSEVGKGTQVELILPVQPVSTTAGQFVVYQPQPTETAAVSQEEPLMTDESTEPGKPLLLLAEDNTELREFMAQTLAPEFRVLTATNGEEGWRIAQHEIPDLVISDLMMPVMDGYALCRQLKTNPATDHIAVMLLTARSSQESRLEGFSYGADEYLTKPFHVGELQLRIRNIVARQQKLRRYYAGQLSATEEPLQAGTVEDPFLQKVYGLLDEHLDNSSFGVDQLADRLAMSRRTLHRKLTTLIDLPTSSLIQQYRLKRAAELLKQGQPVSQTAYQVGFDSPQYFAKAFKDFYHATPSEYSHQ